MFVSVYIVLLKEKAHQNLIMLENRDHDDLGSLVEKNMKIS